MDRLREERIREIAEKAFDEIADKWEADLFDLPGFIEDAIRTALREALAGAWVPVGERLPEPLVDVLIHGLDNEFALAYIEEDGVWWYYDGDQSRAVTHWQPLPPPPPTKENADGE